tara:strand:- start:84 stop:269 length:186 start_codon:yes stop_codon:yes gene_type:complete
MELKNSGQKLFDLIDEEWYMGFFIIFTIILIFSMVKMAREINSSKKFPNPKDHKDSDNDIK